MNKQLHMLLQDSLAHYRARKLKKALNTAQIALEFGLNEGADTKELVNANLHLARIYNTNGKYQNETSFYNKALYHISEAEELNEALANENDSIPLKLMCGKVHLNLKNYDRAKSYLKQSLDLAKKTKDDDNIVYSLGTLSEVAIASNKLSESTQLAEEALEFLRDKKGNTNMLLWNEAYLHLSQAYIKQQDYSRSLQMSQELLRSSKMSGDLEKEVIALRNIAVVCGVKSNYKIGMQYFLEALDKCKSIGFRELYVQLQVNIGTMYAHLYNYPEAVKRYEAVLEENDDILEDKNKLVVFNNLGNIYLSVHQPEKALPFFTKSHLLSKTHGYKAMQAHALSQLCRTKLQLNLDESAKSDAAQAQILIDELGEINGIQINLLNLGEIAFRDNDYEKAFELTEQAVRSAKKMKDDACEIRSYKHIARIFKAIGDYKNALEYEEKYGKIQEAFAKEQHSRQFLDMEIRHAIKEKQKAIEQLTKENEYQSMLLHKSDQIARQNEELLRANEDLKQFAYVASHDLKEPIRMIGSFTQIVQKRTKGLLSEKDHQYFDFINGGVTRINELLDGLLKYATVGNTEIVLENLNMNDLIKVCLTNVHVRIAETNAEIIKSELGTLYGNKSLLIQLFQNLITNALKFNKPGKKPVVEIGTRSSETEHVIFIKDNGIGISPDAQEKIFEIFHRLHPRGNYEGTGIGLAICQKIAKRLKGRLWVESEKDQGATFFFALKKTT